MASKPIAFTAEQRRELKQQNLLPEEIDELQSRLPSIQAWQTRPPARATVRAHIRKVSQPLRRALAALCALEATAFPDDGPEGPALDRLVSSAFRRDTARVLPAIDALEAYTRLMPAGDGPNLKSALSGLASELDNIEQQLLASGQNHPAAPWQAIKQIVDALLWGFIKHHQSRGVGLVRHSDDAPSNPLPAYDGPTVSTAGRFGLIATVCYEAAGIAGSPDKAIRAYQAREDRRRHRRAEERRQENRTLPPSEKWRDIDLAVAPRKRGRQRK